MFAEVCAAQQHAKKPGRGELGGETVTSEVLLPQGEELDAEKINGRRCDHCHPCRGMGGLCMGGLCELSYEPGKGRAGIGESRPDTTGGGLVEVRSQTASLNVRWLTAHSTQQSPDRRA